MRASQDEECLKIEKRRRRGSGTEIRERVNIIQTRRESPRRHSGRDEGMGGRENGKGDRQWNRIRRGVK